MPPKREKKKICNMYFLKDAAWHFAHAVLWGQHQFSEEEITAAKACILDYFRETTHTKKAFVAFCERVILTEKYLSADKSRYVPNPSVWLNKNYQHGFAGTKSWYQGIEAKRVEVPGYLKHLTLAATYFLSYVRKPSAEILKSCRNKLLALNAKNVLQHFYNSIVHFNHFSD